MSPGTIGDVAKDKQQPLTDAQKAGIRRMFNPTDEERERLRDLEQRERELVDRQLYELFRPTDTSGDEDALTTIRLEARKAFGAGVRGELSERGQKLAWIVLCADEAMLADPAAFEDLSRHVTIVHQMTSGSFRKWLGGGASRVDVLCGLIRTVEATERGTDGLTWERVLPVLCARIRDAWDIVIRNGTPRPPEAELLAAVRDVVDRLESDKRADAEKVVKYILRACGLSESEANSAASKAGDAIHKNNP